VAWAVGDRAPELVRQLCWRDFAHHVAWWWPEMVRVASQPWAAGIEWDDPADRLDAWKSGRTGYPAVDAALRQLAEVGWISNRARLIAGSFLCRDLLLDWRQGGRHFLAKLEDGDVAVNAFNWQWVAGVGIDPPPEFRILNPVRQGERFDPSGAWVRAWVPELRDVPDAWIHRPWLRPGGPPRGYPGPIVDHGAQRQETRARWARARTEVAGSSCGWTSEHRTTRNHP
jgi:deoxyribodipyrimidine photo-lyase